MLRSWLTSVFFVLLTMQLAPASAFADSFACTAQDVFGGDTYTEAGGSEKEAREKAMDECWSETGHACVAQCFEKDISGGFDKLLYACVTTDKTQETWTEVGATLKEARAASLAACAEDAGVNCRTFSCSFVR